MLFLKIPYKYPTYLITDNTIGIPLKILDKSV